MIEFLKKLGMQEMYLNIMKTVYDKYTANILLNEERGVEGLKITKILCMHV
jgi:hypothetical protein